ncbi:MAG: hypothetical protein ACRCYU_12950 [Nocardioides sp.]
MLIGLLAGIASAVLFGAAAVAQATAVRSLDSQGDRFAGFIAALWRNPALLGVVAAYLAGFVLHAVAIALTPLYLAQATVSLSLPVTAWLAARRLAEPLGLRGWGWVGAIAVGLVLLAASTGTAGQARGSGWFSVAVWAGAVLILVFAWRCHNGAPLVVATVAGLGYAGSALAVRGVSGLEPASTASALAVPTYGVVAFWLYSLALDRSTAAGASGSVIVYQTLLPSVVGVVWLGDTVRSGAEAGIIGGLALAVTGAVALAGGSTSTHRSRG